MVNLLKKNMFTELPERAPKTELLILPSPKEPYLFTISCFGNFIIFEPFTLELCVEN